MANTVKQAFNALTPEQQEIVRTRRFAGARSPDEWIALLGPVAEYDAHADHVASDCPLAAARIQQETGLAVVHPVSLLRLAYGLPERQ